MTPRFRAALVLAICVSLALGAATASALCPYFPPPPWIGLLHNTRDTPPVCTTAYVRQDDGSFPSAPYGAPGCFLPNNAGVAINAARAVYDAKGYFRLDLDVSGGSLTLHGKSYPVEVVGVGTNQLGLTKWSSDDPLFETSTTLEIKHPDGSITSNQAFPLCAQCTLVFRTGFEFAYWFRLRAAGGGPPADALAEAIVEVPELPKVHAAFTAQAIGPNRMRFDASSSSGNVESYIFGFGDGTSVNNGASPVAEHEYAAPGTYTVFLQTNGESGHCDSVTKAVKVGEVSIDIDAEAPDRLHVKSGDTVAYRLTATPAVSASHITITNTLPPSTTIVSGSIKPPGTVADGNVTWEFANPGTTAVVASFKIKVEPQPPDLQDLVDVATAHAQLTAGGSGEDTQTSYLKISDGDVDVAFVDANPAYLSDPMLPSAGAVASLVGRTWTGDDVRHPSSVAADGVSLILLVTKVDAPKAKSVRFELRPADGDDAAPGGLVAVTDVTTLDTSDEGGHRDDAGDGSQTLTTPIRSAGKEHYAYALYRAPRNFDGSATGAVRSRTVPLRATCLDSKGAELHARTDEEITVVRPLVVFQHGTFDSPDGWSEFPLWTQTGNEVKLFQGWSAKYPFQTTRTSFASYVEAAGYALTSARVELDDLERVLADWRAFTGAAGAQADVVTHSYGGVVTRLLAQGAASSDPDPLTIETRSFRSARNWGHGLIHKLITIACTHRGSHTGNHLGVLNTQGRITGLIRDVAEGQHAAIDKGAVEDQMVLSPLLRTLGETRVPGHAIVGSGVALADPFYAARFFKLWFTDRAGGPYQAVGPLRDLTNTPIEANYRKLTNYTFDLDYGILSDDTSQDPNYDLTVSSYSMRGRMPASATSDHVVLEAHSGLAPDALVGRLTHGDEIWMGAGDPEPVFAVADRVAWLLRQPTTSNVFAHFPATMAAPPTALEQSFSNPAYFQPAWLYVRSLFAGSSGSSARHGTVATPDLVLTPSQAGDLVAGQTISVDITWPGKTVASGFASWSVSFPAEEGFVALPAGATSFEVTVPPSYVPGPFTVLVFATAADATTAEARLQFDVEAAESYVALANESPVVELHGTAAVPVRVYGKRADGTWQSVARSKKFSVESADPSVVSIDAQNQMTASALGSTTVTATLAGVGSVELTATVAGVKVPLKAPKKLKAVSTKAVRFTLRSTAVFDARRIAVDSVRIAGVPSESLAFTRPNRQGLSDAVVTVVPAALGLTPGPHPIGVTATTEAGTFVYGSALITVK